MRQYSLLCTHPIGWGHKALMAVVCLSVCQSVYPVPGHKSRTEGLRMLKIGTKKAHDTGDPYGVSI